MTIVVVQTSFVKSYRDYLIIIIIIIISLIIKTVDQKIETVLQSIKKIIS